MTLRTAQIALHVDEPALRSPINAKHFVATRKALEETRRAIEELAPLVVASLPSATERLRGRWALVRGGAGVADSLFFCHKDSADAYIWTQLL